MKSLFAFLGNPAIRSTLSAPDRSSQRIYPRLNEGRRVAGATSRAANASSEAHTESTSTAPPAVKQLCFGARPSARPSPYSWCNPRRLPLLPSLAFASFKAAHVSSSSSLLPSASRPRFCTSFTARSCLAHSPLSRWRLPVPFTMPTQRLKGRVCFSAGSSEGSGGKERLVQHLLVGEEDLKILLELQRKISEGVDLSDLAVEYSICPSKENGGMLGWVRRGEMAPEFEEAAFNAPVNKVVRCKTKFGWHLLEVLSERDESLLQDIQPEELHSKMQDPSFIEEVQLMDVREPDEVDKASLPGFKVLPLRQFGTWGSEIMNHFDPQKDTYVLCHHGMRSLQVAQWLQTQGFKRVFNVAGGIHAYALKADPSIPTY